MWARRCARCLHPMVAPRQKLCSQAQLPLPPSPPPWEASFGLLLATGGPLLPARLPSALAGSLSQALPPRGLRHRCTAGSGTKEDSPLPLPAPQPDWPPSRMILALPLTQHPQAVQRHQAKKGWAHMATPLARCPPAMGPCCLWRARLACWMAAGAARPQGGPSSLDATRDMKHQQGELWPVTVY